MTWLLLYRSVFRTIIPEPERRRPIHAHHVPHLLLPFILLFLMGYLSRRPDTHHLRLSLLPLVICVTFGTYFGFMFTSPELNIYNWGQGLVAEVICAKAIDMAWRKEGMLKTGETKLGVCSKPNGNASCEHHSVSSLPPWLYDSVEVALTTRGLGWQYSAGIHVPTDTRPRKRTAFLWATVLSTLRYLVIFDAMESLIKLVPEVGTPQGGSIFKGHLPPFQRYLLSTGIHLATGMYIVAGLELVHGCIALIALTALSSSPEMWPPLTDNPWISDSLHTFWAKRWHQVLRQTFLVYGGFPGQWIGGDLGRVFGTFFASGMFHECSAYLLGRGFSWLVVVFFTLQAPLLLLEKAWRRMSGSRVGGPCGMLWVCFCMCVMAQPLVDSWCRRGLGGWMIIPPCVSPARRVFLPLLRRVEGMVGFGPLTAMLD